MEKRRTSLLFLISKVGGKNIEDTIKENNVITVGEHAPAYYFSNLIHFKTPKELKDYPKWNNFLNNLKIKDKACNVVQTDNQALFNTILPALQYLK